MVRQAPVTGEGAADFIAGIFPAEEQASAPCSDREKIAQLEAELVAAKEESADKAEEIAKLRTQVRPWLHWQLCLCHLNCVKVRWSIERTSIAKTGACCALAL